VTASQDPEWAVDVCRDRVMRAGEIRDEIGRAWGQHVEQVPRRFNLIRSEPEGHWTVVLDTLIPMPVRLSTLFGEWLYLLRAALDGLVYYLAVRDSGQSPPPAEQSLSFPVFVDASKYDGPTTEGDSKHFPTRRSRYCAIVNHSMRSPITAQMCFGG
jgi:hypothetical protein